MGREQPTRVGNDAFSGRVTLLTHGLASVLSRKEIFE
jgi:hypothetical protein